MAASSSAYRPGPARPQHARARPSTTYTRRNPEAGVLYRVLQQHLAIFLNNATQAQDGTGLPQFVARELQAFADASCATSSATAFLHDDQADPFAQQKASALAWSRFSKMEAGRTVLNLQPFVVKGIIPSGAIYRYSIVAITALAIALFIASRKRELRPAFMIASLAGFAWIFAMRGLTAFHDFTTMFILGFDLIFFTALLHSIPERFQLVPALLACACLVASTHLRNQELARTVARATADTRDLERIAAKLAPGQAITTDPSYRGLLPGVPFALGFLLPKQPILKDGGGSIVVSSRKLDAEGKNLTPRNKRIFLYKTARPYQARPARKHSSKKPRT